MGWGELRGLFRGVELGVFLVLVEGLLLRGGASEGICRRKGSGGKVGEGGRGGGKVEWDGAE